MRIRCEAYAKLNLSLRVLSRREDGFHEIHSLVQTIDLFDRIEVDDKEREGRIVVENDRVPEGEDIMERAADVLLRTKGVCRGVRIRVEKTIPLGAGLGGGSSDAAAVLRAIDALIPPSLPPSALLGVAAEVGSDVPLFLAGGLIHVRGRGERLEKAPAKRNECYVVLVPPIQCSTAAVYRRWCPNQPTVAGKSGEAKPGENDLLRPALELYPELIPFRAGVERLHARYWGMSGSGASFFAAYPSREEADQAGSRLRTEFANAHVFVCSPTDVGHRVMEEDA